MVIHLAPQEKFFQGRMTSSPRHVLLPSPYFWSGFDSLDKISTLRTVNPLRPGIKLQILLLCFHTFLAEMWGEAFKKLIQFDWSDFVLNSHDLTN